MMGKTLSVVIPTYNMEAYLPRCLDSVTREDIPDTLEVIVVNDGSKDRSLEIAKEYQAKRPDIISIIDKSNGHYGSCINAALKVATGKYFRPLDADDWFDTNALIEFLKELENSNADLVLTAFKCYRPTKLVTQKPIGVQYNTEYTPDDKKIWQKQTSIFMSMQATTFKLEVLKASHLKLSEGICYSDSEFVFYPLKNTKKSIFLNLCLYNYDLSRDGQSMNPAVAAKNHSQSALIIEKILSNQNTFSALERKMFCSCLMSYYYRMLFLCKDDKELRKIDKALRNVNMGLWNLLNKSLANTPLLWRIFGIHFFWYEPLKRFFHIDR